MICSRCDSTAIYSAYYSGENLCRKHLEQSIERRVKQEIRSQVSFGKEKTRIAIAFSGGKDSSVMLYLLHKLIGNRRNLELTAVTVDEGISGYRNVEMEGAKRLCSELGISHRVLSFSEKYGRTMDEIARLDREAIPCSHCGPMRRQVLNILAREVDADYIALGMNLDDYAQSILMNVIKGDVSRMARLAPHDEPDDLLVRRILPLKRIPEKEVMIYAIVNGIKAERIWCPYYGRAERNEAREIITALEEKHPGTAYSIAKFGDAVKHSLKNRENNVRLGRCKACGNPTESDMCSVCMNLERLNHLHPDASP
jgi:uncharacterized protein (TIGR00269 family)